MKNEYDLFERFPNGSSLWLESVPGYESIRLRLQELSQQSGNQYYAISLTTGEVLAFTPGQDARGLLGPLKAEKRSKSQVA